jgi:hypothetical protein
MGTRIGVALDQQNCGPNWRRTFFAAQAHLIVSEGCVERFAVVCEELLVGVHATDLISGRRLLGKRGSEHRVAEHCAAERKTGGQPEPGNAHG